MEGKFLSDRAERKQRMFSNAFSVILCALILMMAAGRPDCLWASKAATLKTENNVARTGVQADSAEDAEGDGLIDDLLSEAAFVDDTRLSAMPNANHLPVRYEGELLTSIWAPNAYDDRWYTSDRLDLKGWAQVGDFDIAGRFKIDYQNIESSGKTRADVRELYAGYPVWAGSGRRIDVAVGKKMIYWGKGDEVRPIDRVSAQDLTAFYFYDLNERKTGRLGAFVDINLGRDVRFEGFWSPYFEASDTPGLGDYFEPVLLRKLADSGIAVGNADEPDEWSSDAGLGGRFMFSVLKADIAFYAFQGFDPNPTYVLTQLVGDPVYTLPIIPRSMAANHPRITLYGADIERTLGPVVLRAEAAYQSDGALFAVEWAQDPMLLLTDPRGVVEKRQLQYVFGMDKNDLFIRNLFFNFQFLGSHIVDHDPQMAVSQSQTGVTALLRYAFLDSKASVWYRLIVLFDSHDQRHHLEMAYKPLPWAQVALGGICYEGKDASTFGQYDDRDMLYGKVKLIF